jgi:hypothetical protein
VQAIQAEIRALLVEPDWDTYSMVAEVSDGSVRVAAFRYTEVGPPVPTAAPGCEALVRELHRRTFDAHGQPWDVVLVQVRREAPDVGVTFSSGGAADEWRVRPQNLGLAEALRRLPGGGPRPRARPTVDLPELAQAIAADLLGLPELRDPEWVTVSLLAEVTEHSVMTSAYRYSDGGPPVPIASPDSADRFWALRDLGGAPWDAVLVEIDRDRVELVLNFRVAGAATARVGPIALEVPLPPVPVHTSQDVNLVIGDRTKTTPPAAVWPEVARHRHAVWAGRAVDGAFGLLVRARSADAATRVVNYEPIGVVRLSDVAKRPDGGLEARPTPVPAGGAGDLDGVVDRTDLRDLLHRAADRDPAVAAGWRRPAMRPSAEVADLAFGAVAEDLLRRLPMPLSTRVELMTRPERERFAALIDQLREIADGTPPGPERAQRLDRPPTDLPAHAIPVLVGDVWLTPGNVSTVKAGATISELALSAGWLAFTTDLKTGQAVMLTRPVRRSETADADGWYALTTDQLRPALIRALVRTDGGRSLVELTGAPSAADGPDEAGQLPAYLELLKRAYARDPRVVGGASGTAYRLWQAGRFTSLRALLSWQIGQLGFGAQAVLDLQAVAAADRLRALSTVLRGVADGRPRAELISEVSAAVRRDESG